MKSDADKSHLLIFGFQYDQKWTKIGYDKILESAEVKLLDVTIDNNLKSKIQVWKLPTYIVFTFSIHK